MNGIIWLNDVKAGQQDAQITLSKNGVTIHWGCFSVAKHKLIGEITVQLFPFNEYPAMRYWRTGTKWNIELIGSFMRRKYAGLASTTNPA